MELGLTFAEMKPEMLSRSGINVQQRVIDLKEEVQHYLNFIF